MFSSRRYYFLKIADTLNMTRASELLHVSQPSLSQYLNKLETELNVKLVDRSYTPLRLTDAGKVYYEYLLESKQRDDALEEKLRSIRENENMPLKIGIPLQKSHQLTREVLPMFCAKHPTENVSIWEGTSRTVRDRVADGELEIGFGHTMSDKDPDCLVQVLNMEKLHIICHKDNPIVAGMKAPIDDPIRIEPTLLNDQLFYQMAKEYFLFEVESADLKQYKVNPKNRFIMSNLRAIISAVLDSRSSGFAYMPDFVFDDPWPKSVMDDLAFLKLGKESISWNFSMMRRKDVPLSASAKYFWDCVMESCCEEPFAITK